MVGSDLLMAPSSVDGACARANTHASLYEELEELSEEANKAGPSAGEASRWRESSAWMAEWASSSSGSAFGSASGPKGVAKDEGTHAPGARSGEASAGKDSAHGSLSELADSPPSLGVVSPDGAYGLYKGAITQFDSTLGWRFSRAVSLYVQGRNITNVPVLWYASPTTSVEGRDAAFRRLQAYGANWVFGVKGMF